MNSAAPYIKEAVVLALNKDDFSAVNDLTSLLRALHTPATNGHHIPKTLTDIEPKYTPNSERAHTVPNPKKHPRSMSGTGGRFKNNEKVHSCYEIVSFYKDFVFPQIEHGTVLSSVELYTIGDKIAVDLDWYLEGDNVGIKKGGSAYIVPRFRALLARVFADFELTGHLERTARPVGRVTTALFFRIVSPLAQNAPQSQN